MDRASTADILAKVEVLITAWGCPRLTEERLTKLPHLRAVFHGAGSVRTIVSDAFWERDIAISSAAHVNAIPVAEFTFASIVLAGKRAQFFARDPRGYHYRGREKIDPSLSNLRRRIGVVGFSNIGQQVVRLLQNLAEVEVLVFDPFGDATEINRAGARLVSLNELLRSVDTLSLHAPLLPSTRGMIGSDELARLEDGAIIINTARGALIDTEALTAECKRGRLRAVLDVTEPEPLPLESPLYDLPNVSITPHVAGSLGSETLRLTDCALDELERYTKGEPLHHGIDASSMEVIA
ncbi:hydroxyacid dehydrogenase [Arthrobacter tecti]